MSGTHRRRLSALLAFALLSVGPVHAQWNVELHGVIDANLTRASEALYWNQRNSRVAVQLHDDFSWGWKVRGTVEYSFGLFEVGRPDKPTVESQSVGDAGGDASFGPDCSSCFLSARNRTVALSHYAYGRMAIGLQGSLIGETIDRASPWGGDTVASDLCAAVLDYGCLKPRRYALQYDAPQWGNWLVNVQFHRAELEMLPGDVRLTPAYTRSASLALTYAAGATQLSIAHERGEKGTTITPAALRLQVGPVQFHLLHTSGKVGLQPRKYEFGGVTMRAVGGELRLGVGRYQAETDASTHRKMAAGWHKALAPGTVLYMDWSRIQFASGTVGRGADIGLRLRF